MKGERGAALVEFSLVSVVLYLMLAGAIDFGRLMFSAQAVQDAARVAARELALTPLDAGFTFDVALADPNVIARVFNPACLVIDRDEFAGDPDPDAALEAFVAGLPIVNRALRPLMIVDLGPSRNLLRYPGALLQTAGMAVCVSADTTHPTLSTNLTVGIPRITGRSAEGFETIEWLPVLEEVTTGTPPAGPFSLDPSVTPTLSASQRGLAAVRINYPYQAALLTSFRPNPAGPFEPNVGNVNLADDASVTDPGTPMGTPIVPNNENVEPFASNTYAGAYGLGRQLAFAESVRPFRRVLSGQAIYRREVFQ
jgi:hypothetical protein